MLTILHPELMSEVLNYPIGLHAFTITDDKRPVLVVKVPKEALLAARLNKGFKMYVVPVAVNGKRTVGIVSAFFDDEDEPLVVFTPLFDDLASTSLRGAMHGGELDVHLFDECSRELLGYSTQVHVPLATETRLEQACFLPFEHATARTVLNEMPVWFRLRNAKDDAEAIAVDFCEALFPEDLFVQDLRPEHHAFHGSPSHSHTTLVRQEPGRFQEHDIVRLLQRIFPPEQIYLNPLRVTDEEEVADVIVITDTRVLLIQAKDSPNTEHVLRNTLARKIATSMKSLKKAIEQVKGAVRYAQRSSPMRMLLNGEEVAVSIDHLKLTSMIVLKEMFDDQYGEYSPLVLQLVQKTQVPCIALSYSELHMYTAHLADEEDFFTAYDRVFNFGLERGEFPRLRMGVGGS